MQKLTKSGELADFKWTLVAKEEAKPEAGLDLLIHISDLEKYSEIQSTGVWLDSDDTASLLQNRIEKLEFVAINFPVFADGRGFSIASQLRTDMGFSGEICAMGNFMPDQIYYLKRCGFDSFVFKDGDSLSTMRTILEDFSTNYQGSTENPSPLFHHRTV